MSIRNYVHGDPGTVEFLESFSEEDATGWLKVVTAFANTNGGTLVFGVKKDKTPVGIGSAAWAESGVARIVEQRIAPIPQYRVSLLRENGMDFLLIKVSAGPALPYYCDADGKLTAYVRIGTQTAVAPSYMLSGLILKGLNRTFDGIPSPIYADKVTFGILESAFRHRTKKTFRKDRDLLAYELVGSNGALTYAGALFCDQGPLRQSRIVCTHWKGTKKGGVQEDSLGDSVYTGGLLSLLENSEAFIGEEMEHSWNRLAIKGRRLTDYPREAIREALVNAIAHRDYQTMGAAIYVDIYEDRLEIISPGSIPARMGPLRGVAVGHLLPVHRNPIVADILCQLAYMEHRGSGLMRMLHGYDEYVSRPKFLSGDEQFVAIFPKCMAKNRKESVLMSKNKVRMDKESALMERKRLELEEVRKKELVPFIRSVNEAFEGKTKDKTQVNVVQLFKRYGYDTSFGRLNVVEVCEVKKDRATKILSMLLESGFIERQRRNVYRFERK